MKRFVPWLVLMLGACAGQDEIGRLQPAGYIPDAARMVAEANWSAPETISVTLADHAFSPDQLDFHRDRPTRLVLRNATDGDHSVVSPGFFQAIAVRQLGESAGPYVEKIVVPAGQTKEMWFVPGRYGAWRFECDVTGHALLGEKGLVNIGP